MSKGFGPALNPAQLLDASKIVEASVRTGGAKCGVYFLIKNGDVKYVGQSINVEARVAGHHSRGFDRWHWVPCPQGRLNALERAYIDVLMPPWNMDDRSVTRRWMMEQEKLPPAPLEPYPFAGIDPEKLTECRREQEEYAATHWIEARVVQERMRRVRSMKRPDRPDKMVDFGPMPRAGDPFPE